MTYSDREQKAGGKLSNVNAGKWAEKFGGSDDVAALQRALGIGYEKWPRNTDVDTRNWRELVQYRMVDFVGFGDSNQAYDGHGWDHGFQYALDKFAPMYGTGLLTYAENNFNGSGLGWQYSRTDNNIGTGTDPHSEIFVRNAGSGLSPHLPMYLDTGTLNGSGPNGVIVNAESNLSVEGQLIYEVDYARFDSGGGELRLGARREEAPYNNIDSGEILSTDGPDDWATARKIIAANSGREGWKISCRFAAYGTTVAAPIATLWQTVINAGRSNGWRYTTGLYRGGVGLRTFAGDINGLSAGTWEYFWQRIRARQLEQGFTPLIYCVINSGLNDRGDSNASVGPNPAASNTAAGFSDNLEAIRTGILDDYPGDHSELKFVVFVSHPISAPDDSTLTIFRQAAAQFADGHADTQALDITAHYSASDFTANGWYQSGGADTAHLTQAAYEAIATELLR